MIPERHFALDYAHLYHQYGDIIYGCAREFTEDDRIAAEILKNSLECLVRNKKKYDESKMNFLTYVRQIVREKAVDALNTPLIDTIYSIPRTDSRFLQVAEMLSPTHRDLFYGRYYEGRSESLLAAETGLPETDVKLKLRETVKKLREYL